MKYLLLSLSIATLFTQNASALTKNIKLHSRVIHTYSNDVIHLKQMLMNQEGNRELAGYELLEVSLMAKSRFGDASASLVTNRSEGSAQMISGNEENFESDYSYFNKLKLTPSRYSYGDQGRSPMQIHISGEAKIQDIEVKLKKEIQYDYRAINRMALVQFAEFKADKFIGSTETVNPRSIVRSLQLLGTKEKVNIDLVEIHFMDGSVVELDELKGRLKNNQVKNFSFRQELAKPISKIKVSATTTSLFGSRGRLAILTN